MQIRFCLIAEVRQPAANGERNSGQLIKIFKSEVHVKFTGKIYRIRFVFQVNFNIITSLLTILINCPKFRTSIYLSKKTRNHQKRVFKRIRLIQFLLLLIEMIS